jgi:hypothetical protein
MKSGVGWILKTPMVYFDKKIENKLVFDYIATNSYSIIN